MEHFGGTDRWRKVCRSKRQAAVYQWNAAIELCVVWWTGDIGGWAVHVGGQVICNVGSRSMHWITYNCSAAHQPLRTHAGACHLTGIVTTTTATVVQFSTNQCSRIKQDVACTLEASKRKNQYDLSSRLKLSSSPKCAGRLLHTHGQAEAKLLSSNVLCVRGTAHDLAVNDHSRRLRPSKAKRISSEVPGRT